MIDFKLMEHQEMEVFRSSIQPDLFLAWEMGTGKTCTTIQMIRARCEDTGRLRRTLILAPLIVLNNWKKEFALFSNIEKDSIIVLDGPVKNRVAKVRERVGFNCIFLCNYDVINDLQLSSALESWGPEILVCDESHNLKNYQSKRAKAVAHISDLPCVRHRYLLTGTPILNNAMDLFMQYRILDGYLGSQSTFGSNFFAFRSAFFYDANANWKSKHGYFPNWLPREGAYNRLMQLISHKTSRVTKDQCLDLPDLVTQEIEVGVSSEQKKAYEEMRKDFITFVQREGASEKPRAVVARLAVTKALRLQQIISGFYRTDDGEVIRIASNPRIDALKELLETLIPGNKVIVWACFKENYQMIKEVCDELKIKSCQVTGEQTKKEKDEAVKAFNEDPTVRVLVGNQGAGGVGINLVQASYSIYYSRSFKLGDDLQSESRNHRRGSEIHSKVTRINLVAKNSIDSIVSEALSKKIDISNQILDLTNQL